MELECSRRVGRLCSKGSRPPLSPRPVQGALGRLQTHRPPSPSAGPEGKGVLRPQGGRWSLRAGAQTRLGPSWLPLR